MIYAFCTLRLGVRNDEIRKKAAPLGTVFCHKMYLRYSTAQRAAEPLPLSILYATDGETATL